MDPITLDICWNRLIGVVNEQAAALMRTSFTSIVREAGDLSAGVFDRRGYMIAQAVTGTPGHINSMALAMKHILAWAVASPLGGLPSLLRMLAARSLGPTKMASIPGTEKIWSAASTAWMCSHWSTTSSSSSAWAK